MVILWLPSVMETNMQVTWKASDIKVGQRVCKPGRAESWIIGYDPATHGRKTPALAIISLADGAIAHKGLTPAAVADILNKSGDQPAVPEKNQILHLKNPGGGLASIKEECLRREPGAVCKRATANGKPYYLIEVGGLAVGCSGNTAAWAWIEFLDLLRNTLKD